MDECKGVCGGGVAGGRGRGTGEEEETACTPAATALNNEGLLGVWAACGPGRDAGGGVQAGETASLARAALTYCGPALEVLRMHAGMKNI